MSFQVGQKPLYQISSNLPVKPSSPASVISFAKILSVALVIFGAFTHAKVAAEQTVAKSFPNLDNTYACAKAFKEYRKAPESTARSEALINIVLDCPDLRTVAQNSLNKFSEYNEVATIISETFALRNCDDLVPGWSANAYINFILNTGILSNPLRNKLLDKRPDHQPKEEYFLPRSSDYQPGPYRSDLKKLEAISSLAHSPFCGHNDMGSMERVLKSSKDTISLFNQIKDKNLKQIALNRFVNHGHPSIAEQVIPYESNAQQKDDYNYLALRSVRDFEPTEAVCERAKHLWQKGTNEVATKKLIQSFCRSKEIKQMEASFYECKTSLDITKRMPEGFWDERQNALGILNVLCEDQPQRSEIRNMYRAYAKNEL